MIKLNTALEASREALMERPITVFVTLSGKRRIGKAVKFNAHTMWVKIMIGAKSYIYVQRKYKRDNVQLYKIGEPYASKYTEARD